MSSAGNSCGAITRASVVKRPAPSVAEASSSSTSSSSISGCKRAHDEGKADEHHRDEHAEPGEGDLDADIGERRRRTSRSARRASRARCRRPRSATRRAGRSRRRAGAGRGSRSGSAPRRSARRSAPRSTAAASETPNETRSAAATRGCMAMSTMPMKPRPTPCRTSAPSGMTTISAR